MSETKLTLFVSPVTFQKLQQEHNYKITNMWKGRRGMPDTKVLLIRLGEMTIEVKTRLT